MNQKHPTLFLKVIIHCYLFMMLEERSYFNTKVLTHHSATEDTSIFLHILRLPLLKCETPNHINQETTHMKMTI